MTTAFRIFLVGLDHLPVHPADATGTRGQRPQYAKHRHTRPGVLPAARFRWTSLREHTRQHAVALPVHRWTTRARRMLTEMTPTQQQLYDLFDLDRYAPTPRPT
jgi:hypothetical protein